MRAAVPNSYNDSMNILEIDPATWPHRRDVALNRFIFATRTPVPLPDGFSFCGPLGALGTGHSIDDVNWISLVVHQVVGGPGQALSAARAVAKIANRDEVPGLASGLTIASELQATWSVVEAVTPGGTTEDPDPQAPARSRSWTEDPIMRVMHGLRQLARAERVGTQHLCAIPAYEQVMQPMLAYRGTGEELLASSEVDARVLMTLHPEWGHPVFVNLEHSNLSLDNVSTRHEANQADPVLHKWLVDIELELPGVLWRERLLDARQQLYVEGRYDLAVILFATATEVLIDGLLQMLWWEKGLSDPEFTAATVAEKFDSSKDSVARMNRYLRQLLGGDWSDGPVQRWRTRTWKLRHQCVHGGYYPSRAEAESAGNSSEKVATFFFDRLGEKRKQFPRVCLQILAQSGLEKRGIWGGQIKRFAENEALGEGDWSQSIKCFRDLVDSLRQ